VDMADMVPAGVADMAGMAGGGMDTDGRRLRSSARL
jgi:hypothetical protein